MSLRQIAKKIPGIPFLYQNLKSRSSVSQSLEDIFTSIYRSNAGGGASSVSGPGSDIEQSRTIVREIPRLLETLKISSILDIPCGDFHWMSRVDLGGIAYTGADVVTEIID